MKNLQVVFKCLAISLVAGMGLTGCGTETLPSASALLSGDQISAEQAASVNEALKDVFGILSIEEEASTEEAVADGETLQKPLSFRARFDNLKETHPELYAQVVEIIGLPSNERKERLGDLKDQAPQMMKRHGHHMKGPRPEGAAGFGKGPRPEGGADFGGGMKGPRPDFGGEPPEFQGERPAPEELAAKFEEWKAANPELAAKLESFKDLSPEERKAEFDALRESGVELPPSPPRHPGMKPPHDLEASAQQ